MVYLQTGYDSDGQNLGHDFADLIWFFKIIGVAAIGIQNIIKLFCYL